MSNDGVSIGSQVRGARRRAGLTQAQLSVAAGLSVRTLRDIEHGQIRSPGSTAVTKVIEVLGLRVGAAGPEGAGRSGETPSGPPLQIGVLGPLTVRRGGAEVIAGSPRLRAPLALLALQAGEPVSREELADATWGPDQPVSWSGALSTHISRLRALTGAVIVLRSTAYCLLAGDQETDAARFQALVSDANGTDQPAASHALEAALRCWRGPVLADLDSRLQHCPAAAALSRLRVRTALRYADLALTSGEPEPAAELLAPVAEQEPLDEALQARLIAVLAAAGQRALALAQYETVRCRLADELGIDPGDELKAVLHQVLTQRVRPGRPPSAARPVPAQLPARIGEFTGRSEQLRQLDEAVHEAGVKTAATGVICTITGIAGVGKTALALHWAHRAGGQFTGGQLYANLQGFGPLDPLDPSVILDEFLRALAVPATDLPPGLDAKAALLRSVLAGRRVLLVLDNARDADQVRPLLPGGAPVVVLITSRSRLEGLGIRENARSITVEPFTEPEATALLTRLAGADRAAAEPVVIARIAGCCAGLPLALRIAGRRAAGHHGLPLAGLTGDLDDAGARLDELVTPGDEASSVRSVFSWSYRALPPAQRRLFRLLALHPGPDVGVAAAAALTALDQRQARLQLAALAAANLLQQPHPDRYELHDLLRAYAAELGHATDPAATRTAAQDRMISYYRGAAAEAAGLDDALQTAPLDKARAASWLDTELPNLSALAVAPLGQPSPAIDLSAILWRYLETRGRHSDAVILHTSAVAAATSSGDRARAAQALTCLGLACWRLGRLEEAVGHYEAALASAGRNGDKSTRARALTEVASVCEHLGRYSAAHEFSLQALVLARRTGDRMLQGKAISNLGALCWHQQRYPSALERYEQSLALAREADNRIGQANALANIGHCLIGMARYSEALGQLTAALALSQEAGHAALTAEALDSTAQALVHLHRPDEALSCHRRALELVRTTLDRNLEADILNGFAETAAQTGDLGAAMTYHHQALAIVAASGDRRQAARAHEGLARALRAGGDHSGAGGHLRDAIAIYADLGVPRAGQLRELFSDVPAG
jgi:DNA-binding SARP family transcriptional activator/tetratricopeptide (TPR) repeat protein/DNA-binding XRE family transcriptional regulator